MGQGDLPAIMTAVLLTCPESLDVGGEVQLAHRILDEVRAQEPPQKKRPQRFLKFPQSGIGGINPNG